MSLCVCSAWVWDDADNMGAHVSQTVDRDTRKTQIITNVAARVARLDPNVKISHTGISFCFIFRAAAMIQ